MLYLRILYTRLDLFSTFFFGFVSLYLHDYITNCYYHMIEYEQEMRNMGRIEFGSKFTHNLNQMMACSNQSKAKNQIQFENTGAKVAKMWIQNHYDCLLKW